MRPNEGVDEVSGGRSVTSIADSSLRNVSDTALWVALYRAMETDRSDPLFRDPLVRRLAGERGRCIHESIPRTARHAWAFVMRTVLFDAFIERQVAEGVDLVVNLAAGLDARPYRMSLPPALRWVEVDLPDLIDYKEEILANEKPRCLLERVRLDLADGTARRALLSRLGRESKKALVISEGLIIYLTANQVGELARDLAAQPYVSSWITDLSSPGLLQMMQKQIGRRLDEANAPFKFAPAQGPAFFQACGWTVLEVRGLFTEGVRRRRVPFWMRVFALFPESTERQGRRPWSGVCLLAKS